MNRWCIAQKIQISNLKIKKSQIPEEFEVSFIRILNLPCASILLEALQLFLELKV